MSLVRTLMCGTMESAVDLSSYDYSDKATTESYLLTEACESLVRDIFKIEQAYYPADIIGEVRVIQEGADPEVLLEGMIGDAYNKLKETFKKFLAKIKEWAAKVKKFFKVMFMKGKELAKTYGAEIRKKSTKGFKYKGYEYKISDGDSFCDTASKACDDEIVSLLQAKDITHARNLDLDNDYAYKDENNKDQTYNSHKATTYNNMDENADISARSKVSGLKLSTSSSEYQDKFVKTIQSSCESTSELSDHIQELYRNKESEKYEIEDFEANSPTEMLSFLETFDKSVKDVEKEEKSFEKDINNVIKELDKLSGENKERGNTSKDANYKSASKISSFVSSALTVKKTIIDKKVAMYKEINSSFTSVLKSFLLKKEVKENAFFEDFDSLIGLTEAEDVAEPEPEDISEDDGAKGSSKKKGTEEGCRESLLEAAYNWM